jgi:hypothetical protein
VRDPPSALSPPSGPPHHRRWTRPYITTVLEQDQFYSSFTSLSSLTKTSYSPRMLRQGLVAGAGSSVCCALRCSGAHTSDERAGCRSGACKPRAVLTGRLSFLPAAAPPISPPPPVFAAAPAQQARAYPCLPARAAHLHGSFTGWRKSPRGQLQEKAQAGHRQAWKGALATPPRAQHPRTPPTPPHPHPVAAGRRKLVRGGRG